MSIDTSAAYAAMASRDARFDGVFFVAVTTTGIYCRPICTAKTPGASRCRYYGTAVEAERDGYRACFRCRPEVAPGGATVSTVDAVSRLVANGLAAIHEGALNNRTVESLAWELGVTGRHLRRVMQSELGVSPHEVAQSRRLGIAKQLLHDTAMSPTDIATASGFRSVRRFNAAFVERFGRSPTAVRKALGRAHAGDLGLVLVLRLDYRPPFAWKRLLGFFRRRAVKGVESVTLDRYARVVSVGDVTGVVSVTLDPGRPSLRAELSPSLAGNVASVVAMLRRTFDLDAHPDRVGELLARDAVLAPMVRAEPGLRLPGTFDAFESGVRAMLGQQVSVGAAITLAGRLVAAFGHRVSEAETGDGLTHAFPNAGRIAGLSVEEIAAVGLPRARAEALRGFAKVIDAGEIALSPRGDTEALLEELQTLPGIGPWTAEYIAMRGLHLPDQFPASDLGLRKALGGLSAAEATKRAEAWRPWRSYAVMHLWNSLEGEKP